MSGVPNRMQLHWDEVRPFLRKEWSRLTEADLDFIDGEYDRLIAKVCELYPAPDPITLEAEVKGKMNRLLGQLESRPS